MSGAGVPSTRRGDTVETLHGREVADPYRWLEDPDSPETRAWVATQNDGGRREQRPCWPGSRPRPARPGQGAAEVADLLAFAAEHRADPDHAAARPGVS